MKIKSFIIGVGCALPVVGLIFAWVKIRAEEATLHAEFTRLNVERAEQIKNLTANDRQLHAQDEEEKKIEEGLAAATATLSPERRRSFNIKRAEQMLAAIVPSTPAAGAGAGPLLTQGKAGKVYFSELLGDLDYARAAQTVEHLQIALAYAHFLAGLNLDPAQRAKLEDLLVEREMAKQDLLGLGQDSDPAATMQARVAESRRWNVSAQEMFGKDVVSQLNAYDGTLRLRGAVDDLESRLSYTREPLQPEQSGQLLQSLVGALGPKVNTLYWSIPAQVVAGAETFLTPAQVVALKQIREEQQGIIAGRDARQDAAKPTQ